MLHNSAFEMLGLHTYSLFETPTANADVERMTQEEWFGGASVTIPFKLDVVGRIARRDESD